MKTIKIIFTVELIVFFAGLLFGVTGSSLGLTRTIVPGVSMDEVKILGNYRPIRSDEWSLVTLLALAQYNNTHQFPQLNENLGVEGKKLAIAHDIGVPVKEVSLLGKPATWGFYLFDLRHALSWFWLFPLFIGLNGVWFLLNMVWQKQPGVNFCFSLYLAFSYHSVGWSFWPAWQIGLGCLSTALFLYILQHQGRRGALLASLALGVFLASTVLTIYYPRLIPVLTFLLLLVLAVCIQEKLFKRIYEKKWYLLLAAVITIGILSSWYINNSDAISAMLSSTYPGQRRNYGGSFNLFRGFSGWLDPILIFNSYGFLNSSEASTYYSFILGILAILLFSRVRKDCMIYILMAYMLFAYCYLYTGIPEWLGKLTFWNRTVPRRAVIGVELCQIFIFSWLYSKKDEIVNNKYILSCSLLIPVLIAFVLIRFMPEQMAGNLLSLKPEMTGKLAYCFAALCLAYYIFMNKIKIFPYVLLLITLPITFFWNPLCIAPSFFTVELPHEVKQDKEEKYGGRILTAVKNTPMAANILAASGEHVFNSTSYYTDRDIYNEFYKERKGAFKKFHHMVVTLDEKNTNDIVSVSNRIFYKLNYGFDFSKFKADYLVTTTPPGLLEDNKSVEFLAEKGGFFWYKILHV